METGNQGKGQVASREHVAERRFHGVLAVSIVMLLGMAGMVRAQEAPDPPDPPEPQESTQIYVLNDGTAHLGVTLGDVTAAKAQEKKLPAIAGAIITSVQKNSSAAQAGLETGDTIIEFDGVRVRSAMELRRLIRETPSGRTVEIKIVRDGKPLVLSAKLEAASGHQFEFNMPEIHIPPMKFSEIPVWRNQRVLLGITGDDLTPQLAQYFGVKQGKGVLIFEVTKGGAADKAGLKAGDVIEQVDGKPIDGVEELRDALNDHFDDNAAGKVRLTIVRDHHEQTVEADLARSSPAEKHTSTSSQPGFYLDPAYSRALARMEAQARQLQTHALAERNQVLSEVSRQQQHLHEEWQRQLEQQMLSLKNQMKHMQDLRLAVRMDGEI